MQICPRCGTQTDISAPYCPACGMALSLPPAGRPQPSPQPGINRTMIGIPPQSGAQGAGQGPQGIPDYRRTVLGMPTPIGPLVSGGPPSQATAPAQRTMLGLPQAPTAAGPPADTVQAINPARTMLGMPSPFQPAQQAPATAEPPSPVSAAQPGDLRDKRTLLGVAMPGISPIVQPKPGAPISPAQAANAHRTMLGVAMPGIAPISPGVAPPTPQVESPYYEQEVPPQPEECPPARVRSLPVPVYRRPAVVIGGLGVLVAVFTVVVALLWRSPPPIRAEARIDAKGQDMLRITCASCPDGSKLTVSGVTVDIKDSVAELSLSKPLAVGDNRFVVHIDRPASRRDEDVKLIVPIAYRIRPDLSALAARKPIVQVVVEAAPGTKAVIEGKPLSIGLDGRSAYPLDVSVDCTGQDREVHTIDRSIPYEITLPGGQPDKGSVTIKVGITPLVAESPRPNLVVDTPFVLVAGRSSKNAVVELNGTQLAVGPDGAFSKRVPIETAGASEMTLRATAPDQAPRIAVLKINRVTSLEMEAQNFQSTAKLSGASLLADPKAHVGEPVAIQGEVVESRVQGNQTIVLLELADGCKGSPCLVRLVRAGTDAMRKGERVRVFGHVSGSYEAKGTSPVPEVDVDFLLPAKAGR